MRTAVQALGILFICVGVVILLRPTIIKSILGYAKQGVRPHIAAAVRITFAVILFLGAQQCRIHWVIIMFGIIFLLSGLIVFAVGTKKAGQAMGWVQNRPIAIFRIFSVLPLAAGTIIIFSA